MFYCTNICGLLREEVDDAKSKLVAMSYQKLVLKLV